MSRSIALAVTLVFGTGALVPALAQTTPSVTTDKSDKKTGKKSTKTEDTTAKKDDKSTGDKGNKGGETRALDRADQVAGDHGAKGREVARGKPGK